MELFLHDNTRLKVAPVSIDKEGNLTVTQDGEQFVIRPEVIASTSVSEDEFDLIFCPLEGSEGNGLFETYGEDLENVLAVCKEDESRVWTMCDGDDGGVLIEQGYHLVNRISYIITEYGAPWEVREIRADDFDHDIIQINSIDANPGENAQSIHISVRDEHDIIFSVSSENSAAFGDAIVFAANKYGQITPSFKKIVSLKGEAGQISHYVDEGFASFSTSDGLFALEVSAEDDELKITAKQAGETPLLYSIPYESFAENDDIVFEHRIDNSENYGATPPRA